MSAVRVTTRNFEASHGASPRGFGNWGFFFSNTERRFDAEWTEPEFFSGTFTEARTQARRFARDNGFSFADVAS